jgi:hypothetical protein
MEGGKCAIWAHDTTEENSAWDAGGCDRDDGGVVFLLARGAAVRLEAGLALFFNNLSIV